MQELKKSEEDMIQLNQDAEHKKKEILDKLGLSRNENEQMKQYVL